MNAPDFSRLVGFVQSELAFVQTTIKDKGANRFARPLVLGGALIFSSYWFIYSPPIKKLAGLDRKLNTARATAEFADQYKEVRERLYALYGLLPAPSDPSLTEAIVDSLKTQNIMADSLQPPVVTDSAGLLFQSVNVTMTLKFSELTAWLLRIEAAKPLLHVSRISIKKKQDALGKSEVTAVLTTVVPTVRHR
jgi:type II secretory pathway component PulM